LGWVGLVVASLGAPVGVFVALDAWIHSRTFAVQEVLVEGNVQLSVAEIREAVGLDRPRNVLTCRAQAMEAALEALPWVRSASVEVRGRRVAIEVEESTLFAVATVGAPVLIDREGVIIRPLRAGDAFDVPLLVGLEQRTPEGVVLDRVALSAVQPLLEAVATQVPRTGPLRELHWSALMGPRLVFSSGLEIRLGGPDVMARWARAARVLDLLEAAGRQAQRMVLGTTQGERVALRLVQPTGGP
jgi:cell division septal protein FtsQ